jgi:hypothetical protein
MLVFTGNRKGGDRGEAALPPRGARKGQDQ